MNTLTLEKFKKEKEKELEELKGACDTLECKVSEIMKELIVELEKQEMDGFIEYKKIRKKKSKQKDDNS